jgi:hypothetical protein
VEVRNPTLFVSRDTGEILDPNKQRGDKQAVSIPPQLPKGISEEELRENAKKG